MTDAINEFLALEAAGGILLMAATALALVAANSPALGLYNAFLDASVEVRVGAINVAKPALLWINDGLMAIFFFLIGKELKREFLEGELSSRRSVATAGSGRSGRHDRSGGHLYRVEPR
jgi:NhaA family Na+:H+ antiporter